MAHIKLGSPGDLRPYNCVDPTRAAARLANTMAGKIGSGAGDYNDLLNWSYYLAESWSAGVGREQTEDGGFLFGTSETRYRSRIMLPPQVIVTGISDESESATSIVPASTIDYRMLLDEDERVAIPFQADGDVTSIWVYLFSGTLGADAEVEVWSGVSEPTTYLDQAVIPSTSSTEGDVWRRAAIAFTATSGTQYWAVVSPQYGELDMPMSTRSRGSGACMYSDDAGSSWATASNGVNLYAPIMVDGAASSLGKVTAHSEFNGTMYLGTENGDIYKWADPKWEYVDTTSAASAITDMVRWFGVLYIASGDGTDVETLSALDVLGSPGTAFQADLFYIHNGYMWRSNGPDVYYSSDLTTWTGPIQTGPTDYPVLSISGLGQDLYVSTPDALVRIAPGDWVYGQTRWGYYSDTNGLGMIAHQGSLYIPQDNSVLRYTENTPIINIWSRDEQLPVDYQGTIVSMAGSNRETLALVRPDAEDGMPSVWSYNNSGWHHVATLPAGVGAGGLTYDHTSEKIWVWDESGFVYYVRSSTTKSSPQVDDDHRFSPSAWIDLGVYYGGLKDVEKDFDSIMVVGDNISAQTCIDLYWRGTEAVTDTLTLEDGVTELTLENGLPLEVSSLGWTYFATATESSQRWRWTDYDERPGTIGFQLGLLLRTSDSSRSPVVKSIITRHHPMIRDRYQWTLPILVSDYQEDVDNRILNYTAAQQKDHLESLYINRLTPFIFQDLDGKQYEVKATHFNRRPVEYEQLLSEKRIVWIFDLTLEQIVDGEYAS